MKTCASRLSALALLLTTAAIAQQPAPARNWATQPGGAAWRMDWSKPGAVTLAVDLTDAPKRLLHAQETIAVQPGPLTLVYPKWIPGEHMPSGPIDNQAGLVITANGQPLKWERDPLEMFAFHLTVPAGVNTLTLKMDFIAASGGSFTAGGSTSANLALLSWNTLLLYPQGTRSTDVMVTPSVTVPADWHLATALPYDGEQASNTQHFKPVPLETLIDSPVLSGRYFREILLASDTKPDHYLDLAADGPEDLALSTEHIADFTKLVHETGALYKSRHYGSYHFLVTLSDRVAHFGLEHHESSDDRVDEKTFTDSAYFVLDGLLLPHEFTHSWNGKYRRPIGLATPNYQEPMIGDGLWVYEGLTEYLGDILAARSGIWTPEMYRGRLANYAAYYDHLPGRTWRDLFDTARMAQVLYNDDGSIYANWRRSTDFYDEGELLWLDVDVQIRTLSKDKKSLNDFTAAFHGLGGDTAPKVVPYTFEDVVSTLNTVAPFDWSAFLHERLDSNQPAAPLGGINRGGWKLVYTDTPNPWESLADQTFGTINFWYSLGFKINGSGEVSDVLKGSLVDQNGIGPGFKILSVNSRAFTPSLLRDAIREAKGTQKPIELITENTGTYKIVTLNYHDGEKYPNLVRAEGEDRLDDILKPMTR